MSTEINAFGAYTVLATSVVPAQDATDITQGGKATVSAIVLAGLPTALSSYTVPIAAGGTGATTKSGAFNALSPMTTAKDLIYGGTGGTGTRLAGNVGLGYKFLMSAGNGSVCNTLGWLAIPQSALSDLNTGSNVTFANLTLSGLPQNRIVITGSGGFLATSTGITVSGTVITAGGFSGPLTGNVTGNASGSSGSCAGNAATVTGFSPASTKVLTVSNSMTLAATDGSTLTIGTGGTLGTAAYTATGAYQAASTNLGSLAGLTYVSSSFVKLTGTNTFTLDTNAYALTNQTMNIGTTSVAINRASAALVLTGITSIDGASASCSGNAATATKSTNLIGGNGTTLLGSVPYQSNTDTTLFVVNTTTTKKFLRQTGNGTNGAAPAWDTLATTDIPDISATYLAVAGTAAKATILATTRAIYGNNFDGSAALTGIIASTYGGTGNGFTKFSGPATAEKTFTIPNASCTLKAVITTNTSLYVATTGNDTTGDGTVGTPWLTLAKAMTWLADYLISPAATVTIYLGDGTYTLAATNAFTHPSGDRIVIQGTNSYTTGVTSVASTSGSAPTLTIVLNLTSAANFAIGDYVTIIDASGGTAPCSIVGCHKLTGVSGNTVTFVTKATTATAPSGAVTATIRVNKAVFTYSTSLFTLTGSVQMTMQYLNIVCSSAGTGNGVTLNQGATFTANYVGFYGSGTAVRADNLSKMTVTYSAAYATVSGFACSSACIMALQHIATVCNTAGGIYLGYNSTAAVTNACFMGGTYGYYMNVLCSLYMATTLTASMSSNDGAAYNSSGAELYSTTSGNNYAPASGAPGTHASDGAWTDKWS